MVGMKAYNDAASRQKTTMFDLMAELPLLEGRSAVAETLCDDWVDITMNQVHPDFWKNLDESGQLQDERTWRAIRCFAANCQRRQLHIESLSQMSGKDEPPLDLPHPVPRNIRPHGILADVEAGRIVSDEEL